MISFDGQPVAPALLRRMTSSIAHRGPDDSGIYISPDRQVGLGNRRLAIQDLSPAGNMPMPNEDRHVWLTFNGEIYNFKYLRSGLIRHGHRFTSVTDTEVMIHLYEERGIRFLDELEGMFAIALWDERKGILLLARDRFGEKPLYYTECRGAFRFASEIKALLEDEALPRLLDIESLNQYLTLGFVQPPRTMFQNIWKLAPGERLVLHRNGQRELTRFWEPFRDGAEIRRIRSLPLETHAHEIRARLEHSVESCLIADVPVGAFLSGGVDSSAVVALMSRKSGQRIESVTLSYPGDASCDELPFASRVADCTGANLHPIVVRSEDAAAAFQDCVYHLDEPVSDPACINTFIASRHLRSAGVPVALVGEGADELFLGYPSYLKYKRIWPLWRVGRAVPKPIRGLLVAGISPLLGRFGLFAHRDLLRRLRDNEGYFLSTDPFFLDGEKLRIAGAQLSRVAAKHPSTAATDEMADDRFGNLGGDFLSRISLAETRMRMAEQLLMRVDKLSMAHSVEVRAPFLNWRMAEYALALPGNIRAFGGRPKSLLKQAVADLVPPETLARAKQGFGTAVSEWCRTWAGELLEHRLESDDLFRDDIISPLPVKTLLKEHRHSACDHHSQLWNLLCVAEWCRRYRVTGATMSEEALCR